MEEYVEEDGYNFLHKFFMFYFDSTQTEELEEDHPSTLFFTLILSS